MDRELRARFNAVWTPALWRSVVRDTERQLGCSIPFRVAETPLFMPRETWPRFVTAAEEIVEQLSRPEFVRAHEGAVPPRYRAPGRGALPQMAQVDFAVVREPDGSLGPRCVELQGFPSLYAFQLMLTDVWATHLARVRGLGGPWRVFFSGLDRYGALALLRDAIRGGHDPDEVVLLDIDPPHQKTYADFSGTRLWFGVDPVCPTELQREGNRLYRTKDGRRIRVRRFYQRIVFDELETKGTRMPFAFDEPLDVEWAPHPAWYFLWSKNSLLALDHPCVPKTVRLSDLSRPPDDLARYVLKPLYSFAGGGVNVEPTAADLERIPERERGGWILQERVEYAPALVTPEGHGVRAEVRMMFVRPDEDARMTLLFNLVRLSRGKMMGVNFNRDLDWVGASVALWPEA